ncbi:NUDIX hydrolase [Archangium sp.]|uniref:NUDIX hydrolase n=1 Tax=Archangium sp. TaxID=1872627 RepID=UPI002D476047|nr:NUDIX domain-containing protein [Archangium sp.]HYO53456.1 NUDIX domain-containing protein [Archangium sp.]
MMEQREHMLLDQVDGRDRPVGHIRRADIFKKRANFRVAHILLFSPDGRLLLQKIAPTHNRHPGYWGSSVAGYVKAGESYENAARRKLQEELGIEDIPLKRLGKISMLDEGAKKFIVIFTATYGGALQPNPEDFAALEFVSLNQFQAKKVKRRFTPTFEHVLQYLFDKLPAAKGG